MANSDVSGQITDGSSNPVPNAKVYLWRKDLAGAGGLVSETTADSSGNFSFTQHPDGTGNTQTWNVAAKDPNGNVQLQSAYDVTASVSGPPVVIDDFESYSNLGTAPGPYKAVGLDAGLTNAQANSGSQSLNIDGDAGGGGFDPTVVNVLSSSVKPSQVQFAYREVQNVAGGAVRWLDSSGDELLSLGSGNPQVQIYNGSTILLDPTPSPNYDTWRKFTVTNIDFSANTCDVNWTDIGGSTQDYSRTGVSFTDSPSDIAEVQMGADSRPPAEMSVTNVAGNFYIDDLSPV